MRRVEQLINDIRFNTNEDSNRFSNIKFNKLFNDAQDEIARIINVKSSSNTHFQENYLTDIVVNQSSYELPADVYSTNYITGVFRKLRAGVIQHQNFEPLRLISVKEIGRSVGYFIQDNQIVLSLVPSNSTTDGLMVTYTKRIPKLSVRFGKITAITPTSVTVDGFDEDVNMLDYSDYFCTVDKDGSIIDSGVAIDSYSSGVIGVSSLATASIGDYVVIGEYASSHSILPVECESYLTMYVERMVHYINSSRQDMSASDIFTTQERADITELFADNESDTKYPPIVDSTYLN